LSLTLIVWRSLDNPDVVLLHSSIQSMCFFTSLFIDRLSSGNQDICLGVSSNIFEYCVKNNLDGFIFSYITIFARMKPHQKEKVILIHKQYDFVGMLWYRPILKL
jgi:hypothetical protein